MTDRRTPEGFVHGNPRLAGLLKDPERRARVDEIRAEMDADDRAYRMSLATVRQAGHLTQVELAKRLGVSQGVVSRTETRGDMLYSTLLSYLHAAGVEDVSIVATVGGRRVEIDLEGASAPERTKG